MAPRLGYIELYLDSGAEWRWRLIAGNGRVTDIPGEGFASKGNAKRAALKQHPEYKEHPDRIRTIEHKFK